MCIDIDGHHSGGSSFVYVNDFCYYRNCLYTHRYKFSSEKEKKTGKESQFIVSRPEPVRICHSGWTGNRGVTCSVRNGQFLRCSGKNLSSGH